jgi:hypothetical protein
MNAWSARRHWLWLALAVVVCVFQGPGLVGDLRPSLNRGQDFFQDWASARNRTEGLPVYTPHEITARRYLGAQIDTTGTYFVPINAHPPTSVLLALPLARLEYADAFLAWGLLSVAALVAALWLVGRGLGTRLSVAAVLPAVTLLLICFPFRSHLAQGQLGIILLLLIVGAWVLFRRGWPLCAGALLAVATAIKLFPGLLFLFFLLRRQWRALLGGAVAFALIVVLTAAVLGPTIFSIYFQEVLPQVADFRSGWGNASLSGAWFKLFDPLTDRMRVEALWRGPALARAGAWLCSGAVLAILSWHTVRARSQAEEDQAFGLAVTAMLLVSPITWDHYLVLLLLPLAIIWTRLPPSGARPIHWLFVAPLAALWLDTDQLWNYFLPGAYQQWVATPLQVMTILSIKCYALVGLFALGCCRMGRAPALAPERPAVHPAPQLPVPLLS